MESRGSSTFGRGFGRGRGRNTERNDSVNDHTFGQRNNVDMIYSQTFERSRNHDGHSRQSHHHSSDFEDGEQNILSVSPKFVGRIIGKQGAKIKELQNESGARIQIAKEQNSNGKIPITILGSGECIEKASKLIQEILDSDSQNFSGGYQGRQTNTQNYQSTRQSYNSSNRYGSYSGNQNMDDDDENWDDDDSTAKKTSSNNYNVDHSERQRSPSDRFEDSCSTSYNQGHKNRGFNDFSTSGTNMSSSSSFGREKFGSNSYSDDNNQSGFGKRSGDSQRSFDNKTSFGNSFQNNRGGFGERNNGFGRRDDSNQSNSRWSKLNDSDATIIDVGYHQVGKIIGKGGSTIRQLQEDSGAQIKIDRNMDELSQPVKIIGSDEARAKAKDLINELLEEKSMDQMIQESRLKEKPCRSLDWDQLRKDAADHMKKYIESLTPIEKCFYKEHPAVANMTSSEVQKHRDMNMNISVKDMAKEDGQQNRVPNPILTFDHAFHDYPEILEEIRKQGFEKPSPIQMQAWPVLMKGLNLIGIAQTGTGKTLAFLLPALIHIEGQPIPRHEREGPTVLCLSPTRELAQQIQSEVMKYSYKGIKCVCVYGGGDRREQINLCKSGCEIVVATPGRLNDLISNNILNVKSVTYLILDEADRMLDLGFEYEIKKITLGIRPDRQTIMTSATWPSAVQRMADQYLTDPIHVFVGSLDLAAVHSVTQKVEIIEGDEKRERLVYFLKNEMDPEDKVIIFVGKKAVADDISSDFALGGIVCDCIHGSRDQVDREQAIAGLKSGEIRILIATDVASRGIDIKDVTHVFNYDFPRNIEEYVHRVGRTGRAGRTGISLTLMTRHDWRQAPALVKIMQEAEQEVPPELFEMADRWERKKAKIDNEKKSARELGRGSRFGDNHDNSNFSSFGGRGRRNKDKDGFSLRAVDTF